MTNVATFPRRQRVDWQKFTLNRHVHGLRVVAPFVDGQSLAAGKLDRALVRLARKRVTGSFAQRRHLDGPARIDLAFDACADAMRLAVVLGGRPFKDPPEGWLESFICELDSSGCRQVFSLAGLKPFLPGDVPWAALKGVA